MRDYIQLHFIVLLFGFTAILGKFSTINALELVCYRTLLATISIFAIAIYQQRLRLLPWRAVVSMLMVGIIVALHWFCFFEAIKVSNVSVALGCLSSSTLFTSFIEPLIERRKIHSLEVFIGILIIIGLYIITQFAFNFWQGILYSLSAAFLASLFSVLNRRLVQTYDPLLISGYEMLSGFVAISLYICINGGFEMPLNQISLNNWLCILFLALICTTYAFTAINGLMRRLSAFTTNLTINLEPIYGTILAYFIFGDTEKMKLGFYIGALIIVVTVFGYIWIEQTKKAKSQKNIDIKQMQSKKI